MSSRKGRSWSSSLIILLLPLTRPGSSKLLNLQHPQFSGKWWEFQVFPQVQGEKEPLTVFQPKAGSKWKLEMSKNVNIYNSCIFDCQLSVTTLTILSLWESELLNLHRSLRPINIGIFFWNIIFVILLTAREKFPSIIICLQ